MGKPPSRWRRDYRLRKSLGEPVGAGANDLVDPTATRRQLQALGCLGYTMAELERHSALGGLGPIVNGKRGQVRARVAAVVAKMYLELSDHPPPDTPASQTMKRKAERLKWMPPIAWDDDTIGQPDAEPALKVPDDGGLDEFAIDMAVRFSFMMKLRGKERIEAVRRMHEAGLTAEEIAGRLYMTEWAVQQMRRRYEMSWSTAVANRSSRKK